MADNVTFQSTTAATPPAATVISTEEITTLNGAGVTAQQVQRIIPAARTADGVGVDLVGQKARAQSLPIALSTEDVQLLTDLLRTTPLPVTGTFVASGTVGIDQITQGTTNAVTVKQFNGAAYEDVRGNVSGTVLASAARTAAAAAVAITNYNKNSLWVFLNVTLASGTGGLSVQVRAVDPVSGTVKQLNAAPTAVTASGITTYFFNSGTISASGITQGTNCHVPRDLSILVTHGDGSSYTYSVGYSLQ